MWHYKFKACVKIVLFVNILIIITFMLATITNLFNNTTRKSTSSNEAVPKISETIDTSTSGRDLIMRQFELKRDKDEREIYFGNINSDKEKYQEIINNASSVTFKQISFMPIPEERTYNDVVFKHVHTNLQQKLVHLDLKGAPPKLKYLTSLLKDLQKAGATGLLIEYEDMFPYENNLEVIRAGNAYNKIELQTFLEVAKSYDFEVIPLVQTFGHLEYVLKLKEFRYLREIDSFPDSICPSRNRSLEVIADIIDQIITFHSKIMDLKWIHLGCDEVYHINRCSKCQHRNMTTRQLFVNHVTEIVTYVKMRHPHLTPLIWDDMLRGFQPLELKKSGLGNIVEPVVFGLLRRSKELPVLQMYCQS
ncbi:hexosaminidase D-like isoform X2 [Arctopsyche grandis]|uniref:hexosaminidase D-like isoform X2 n=1 Tax=Arctopsyche grandis TaxID=121162 RepID=UPI00406D99E8